MAELKDLDVLIKGKTVNYSPDTESTTPYTKQFVADSVKGLDTVIAARQSIFNDFYVYAGDKDNVFLDEDANVAINRALQPTALNLVNKPQGASRYKYSDFVYASRFGEISNNRLITMRRFKYPVRDDIFRNDHYPDIGRLCTWSTQNENQLSSLFNFTFGMNWKQLTAAFESGSIHGDEVGYSGFIGKMLKLADPDIDFVQNGLNPTFDSNKVYGPVDSITQTHIRDVGLTFENELELTFKYQLRSIDGVNPKSAMIDLLSHILTCTMNEGKFWGGARYWATRPPSKYAEKLRSLSTTEFQKLMTESNVSVKSFMGDLATSIKSLFDQDSVGQIASNVLRGLAFNKLLDIAGRAAVPTSNSLLTNEPVGEWHVTVGNPFNPTFVCGNMILVSTNITLGDETLGHDDFPTEIVVKCRLKHAMPRSTPEIESMFKAGVSRTYWKPTDSDLNDIHSGVHGPTSIKTLNGVADIGIKNITRDLFAFAKRSGL